MPQKPSELVIWLRNNWIRKIEVKYTHDGMGQHSWVTFILTTDTEIEREVQGNDLNAVAEFNSEAHPISLVELKRQFTDMAFEWEQFEEQNHKDLKEFNRLKKKLGI